MTTTTQLGHDPSNYWTYDGETGTIDLTRGTGDPTQHVTLQTTTGPIRVNPVTTALVIIDMQNYFLSPALRPPTNGTNTPSAGQRAAANLLTSAIPGARAHGIPVVWLNWGLSEEDLRTMPPAIVRTMGRYNAGATCADANDMVRVKDPLVYRGLGEDLGRVTLEDGTTVEGGRILMLDTWNAGLYGDLNEEYRGHAGDSRDADVVVYKDRMSGLWGSETQLERHLLERGITTLLFAGVNTDQCVGSTLTDAFSKGYDCVLLRDGTATTSPAAASEAWEYNCTNSWGFVMTCEALSVGFQQ